MAANIGWIGVAGAALAAGALFLPPGIAAAAEPGLASCDQTTLNCVTHGSVIRVSKSARVTAREGADRRGDADPLSGVAVIPTRSGCSDGSVKQAAADDSGGIGSMASWVVTLLAGDTDDTEDDSASTDEDEDDSSAKRGS